MLAVLRRRLEMAVRVRDFLLAHRAEGIQGAEVAGLARLEELIARAEALAGQQRAGVVARRGSTEQRARCGARCRVSCSSICPRLARWRRRGTRSWARSSGCRPRAPPTRHSSRWPGGCWRRRPSRRNCW